MEQVQVKITGMVITQRYGALSNGYILRTDAAFAKHLVEECHAAEYITAPTVAVDAEKVTKTRTKKPAKATEESAPESVVQLDTPQE